MRSVEIIMLVKVTAGPKVYKALSTSSAPARYVLSTS